MNYLHHLARHLVLLRHQVRQFRRPRLAPALLFSGRVLHLHPLRSSFLSPCVSSTYGGLSLPSSGYSSVACGGHGIHLPGRLLQCNRRSIRPVAATGASIYIILGKAVLTMNVPPLSSVTMNASSMLILLGPPCLNRPNQRALLSPIKW